jgi:hypothetical protein
MTEEIATLRDGGRRQPPDFGGSFTTMPLRS